MVLPKCTPVQFAAARSEMYRKLEKHRGELPLPVYEPPMTCFNNHKTYREHVPYDTWFHYEEGWDAKVQRCNVLAPQTVRDNIFDEEKDKWVPLLTSLNYGRPVLYKQVLDWALPKKTSVASIRDFYRRQGANLSPELDKVPE